MIRIFIFLLPLLLQLNSGNDSTSASTDYQSPVISFGIVTDIQYCSCEPSGSRYFSRSAAKLREAVDDFNSIDLDFVVNLGDMIDREWSSFDTIRPILGTSRAPVYNVLGNHEFDIDPRLRKDVAGYLGTGEGYYSFGAESFRFIVLNSNDISLYSPYRKNRKAAEEMIAEIDSVASPDQYYWDGGIGPEQMEWFLSELEAAAESNQKVIIFSHHPAWPPTTLNILNFREIIDSISRYDHIVAWFCGHNHLGNYGNTNLVHFVNLRGMVETPETNSYAVVEVYNNRVWIKGRGREKSQILAY